MSVATLRLIFHVYEYHSVVSVSKVVDLPFKESTNRLAHVRIPVGSMNLKGLTIEQVVSALAAPLVLPPDSGKD